MALPEQVGRHCVIEMYFVVAASVLCTSRKSRPCGHRWRCPRLVLGGLLLGRAGCKRASRLHSTHAGPVCHCGGPLRPDLAFKQRPTTGGPAPIVCTVTRDNAIELCIFAGR